MHREMFDSVLISLRQRVPFQPFTIALLNGDRFEVDFPNALSVRDGAAVYIQAGGIPVIFDHEGVNQRIGDLMNHGNHDSKP